MSEQGVTRYDVVVVGGGAAGLNAALMLGRARREVLVVDSGEPRNAPAEHVHGFLSRDGATPGDLLEAGRREVAQYGVEIVAGEVVSASRAGSGFAVELADGRQVTARRLLLATGLRDELPDVAGVAERWGRDVLHCPYCHGWEFRDEPIGVLAAGPMSVHQALLFRQWSDRTSLLLNGSEPPTGDEAAKLAARGIDVVPERVEGLEVVDDELTGVRLADGRVQPLRAVAVAPRVVARAELAAELGLETAAHPSGGEHIPADEHGRTAVPGVWVAGNTTDLRATVVVAAASGATAGGMINADLVEEETAHAVAHAPFSPEAETRPCEVAVGNRRHGVHTEEESQMSAEEWDERYRGQERLFSDDPNDVLVAEVAGTPPGQALDVGCGEGGDAIWLARQGWQVTAIDISKVAVERAAKIAAEAAAEVAANIAWARADLAVERPPARSFDLVSAQYFALEKDRGDGPLRALLDAVVPGGTVLYVGHDPAGFPPDTEFDPAEYVQPGDLAALLDDDWEVELDEVRPRTGEGKQGHPHDVVLKARRLR
ncbi:methyltransferase domain-containing protein [Saccharopolyspora rhizosphaerae]|uniref:Methyltransferase domain-containing protein n=1 Tax=Saccharopolyspora rhizosphaerae TaxID=2492662 RepID=A0A3R8P6J8_9PSEU|nr:FAD-dependent oxidoreductase [Saccharopolyspora rhizosphaerae]RRO20627.1 methyltransferase domain-containing protein [Saccharopolyspora rhizosphaerae]